VYLVENIERKCLKCLKIIKKEKFKENEWEIGKLLGEKDNMNIIKYESINEVSVDNNKYFVFELEYANAKVFFINIIHHIYFLFKDLTYYLKFERNSENLKRIEHVLLNFIKQIRIFIYLFIFLNML
jgi:hypothetical protein